MTEQQAKDEFLNCLKKAGDRIAHDTELQHLPAIYDTDDSEEIAYSVRLASGCRTDCLKCEINRILWKLMPCP